MKPNPAPVAALLAALLLAFAWCVPGARAADGNPPDRLTYQGYVVDGNGNPLGNGAPKNYDVVFRIFNEQSGGTRLWSEQQTITVDNGYFSVLLGEGSQYSGETRPALSSLFSSADASDRYVEITVRGIGASGSDSTIAPRLRLLTSPYSFLARNAVHANSLVNSGNGQIVSITGNNVGIQKANPTTPLDVNGTVAATGLSVHGVSTTTTLTVTSNATVNGTLHVTGATTTGALTVNGPVQVNGTSNTVTAGAFVGNGTIPIGGIIMWSGAAVPAGWTLCDGKPAHGQTPPDLRDRFIVGAGNSYAVKDTGGATQVTLGPSHLPLHHHSYADGYFVERSDSSVGSSDYYSGAIGGSGDTDHDNHYIWQRSMNTGDAGHASPTAFDNRPLYYALAFIMRVQ